MSQVVVDASAIGAVILPDEQGPFTALVLATMRAATVVAPAHWPLEVANMILMAWRRRRITDAQRLSASIVAQTIIATSLVEESPPLGTVITLALDHKLTVYDASYVDIGRRHGCPLLTDDADMKAAAKKLGVQLIQP